MGSPTVMEEAGEQRERLARVPSALAARIMALVGREELGYRDAEDFVASALRHEVERAERLLRGVG